MPYCAYKMYFDKGKLLPVKYSTSKCSKVFLCSNVLVKIDLLVFLLAIALNIRL